jgi:predicted aconitase
MELTKEDENALNGKYGPGLKQAYNILVAIGNANNAIKFINIKWAHISGVNFNTIGEAGLKFLKSLDKNTRVSVTTTLNPMGFDSKLDNDLSDHFKEKQIEIVNSYTQLGIKPSFTCIPYEIFDLPKDDYVSFAESNAAVFINSFLKIKTNKESALSALASALTGKAPYSDLLIDEMRKPRVGIKLETKVESEIDYGLLGYFAGKTIYDNCVGLQRIQNLDIINAKALSAGLGTSGMCGMFSFKMDNNNEIISFGKEEMKKSRDELDTAENGELIVFGRPQLGNNELYNLSKLLEGKSF